MKNMQLKPLDIPNFSLSSWAKWIAADANGVWCEYDNEPECGNDRWIPKSHCGVLGVTDPTEVHWTQTLTPVNQVTQSATAIVDDTTTNKLIDQLVEEYDEAWTKLAQYDNEDVPPKPATVNISHSYTYPLIHCDCGMGFVLIGVVADTIFEQGTPPFCPYCGKSMTT